MLHSGIMQMVPMHGHRRSTTQQATISTLVFDAHHPLISSLLHQCRFLDSDTCIATMCTPASKIE